MGRPTDELREYADGFSGPFYGHGERLRKIADRIDAAHERAVMSAMNDALYHANDESMAELGWIRLPVDVDGVSFRIGDKVDSDHYEDGTVTGIQFYETANWGIRTLLAVRPDGWDVATWHTPDEYRHHHEPTVEDMLREFALACEDAGNAGPEVERIAAEYAAKLRLAGDA